MRMPRVTTGRMIVAMVVVALSWFFARRLAYCTEKAEYHAAKVRNFSGRHDPASRARAERWLNFHVAMGRKYRRAVWAFVMEIPPDPPEPALSPDGLPPW